MQKNIIKMILSYKGMTATELAAKLGKSQHNFSQTLKKDNFRESDLQAIAEALDCELVIQFKDKETGKVF